MKQPLHLPRRPAWRAIRCAVTAIALAAGSGAWAAAPAVAQSPAAAGAARETFSHGYFDHAPVYRPGGEPRAVALLVSGAEGWTARDAALAESLRRQGVLTAGIDLRRMIAALRKDGSDCLGPQGDFDNFSRFLQARYQLGRYHLPVLVGSGQVGAAVVYGALATAPKDTFSGAISLGFAPDGVTLPIGLCPDHAAIAQPTGAAARAGAGQAARSYRLRPAARLEGQWLVFPAPGGGTDAGAFAAAVPGAVLMPEALAPEALEQQLAQALARLQPHQQATAAPPAAVGDLPLVEAPATAPARGHDLLAIMLSGDGGWAGIDKDLAAAMNRDGIPVIGFDSLRYFWKARTPESTARDVERVIRHYQSQPAWQRARVLLVGYSQGADVLPFVINRLPPDVRAQVASALLIGMGENASFEFHVANWIGASGQGLPTLPEAARLPHGLALCAYGTEDTDAVCPRLDRAGSPVRVLALEGGHHFDGNYDRLAAALLKAVAAPPPLRTQQPVARP